MSLAVIDSGGGWLHRIVQSLQNRKDNQKKKSPQIESQTNQCIKQINRLFVMDESVMIIHSTPNDGCWDFQ